MATEKPTITIRPTIQDGYVSELSGQWSWSDMELQAVREGWKHAVNDSASS